VDGDVRVVVCVGQIAYTIVADNSRAKEGASKQAVRGACTYQILRAAFISGPGQLECTSCLVTQSPPLRLFEAGRHAREQRDRSLSPPNLSATVYIVKAPYAY
jgi:hypothetical protein